MCTKFDFFDTTSFYCGTNCLSPWNPDPDIENCIDSCENDLEKNMKFLDGSVKFKVPQILINDKFSTRLETSNAGDAITSAIDSVIKTSNYNVPSNFLTICANP